LLQEFCDRRGLDRPGSVMSNQDDTIRQLRALANEVVAEITRRPGTWPMLQKETTFTSVAAELQGAIRTIAPYGFQSLQLDTIYDRTERRPIFGPRGAPAWQENKALPITGPLYTYRIWQGNLYIQPAMPADHTCAFEYSSNWAILAADGTTWKQRYSADTDTFGLDDDLLLTGLDWKWRRAQGISYAQERDDWEANLTNFIGRQSTAGNLNMAGGTGDVRPGIWVPAGNWPIA
jgi:hypothetical protein